MPTKTSPARHTTAKATGKPKPKASPKGAPVSQALLDECASQTPGGVPGCRTAIQWGDYMIKNGWDNNPEILAHGMAVGYCESGFNFSANPWGIIPPTWAASCSGMGSVNNMDDATKCALKLYKASGWTPWDKFEVASGSGNCPATANVSKFHAAAGIVAEHAGGVNVQGGLQNAVSQIGGITNPLQGILDAIERLFQPSFWLEVGKVVLGVAALLLGVYFLGKSLFSTDVRESYRKPIGHAQRLRGGISERRSGMRTTPGTKPSGRSPKLTQTKRELREGGKLIEGAGTKRRVRGRQKAGTVSGKTPTIPRGNPADFRVYEGTSKASSKKLDKSYGKKAPF